MALIGQVLSLNQYNPWSEVNSVPDRHSQHRTMEDLRFLIAYIACNFRLISHCYIPYSLTVANTHIEMDQSVNDRSG